MRRMLKASHIIAHQDGGHRHLQNGVVVWENDQIIHVGKSFDGQVDETIDGELGHGDRRKTVSLASASVRTEDRGQIVGGGGGGMPTAGGLAPGSGRPMTR